MEAIKSAGNTVWTHTTHVANNLIRAADDLITHPIGAIKHVASDSVVAKTSDMVTYVAKNLARAADDIITRPIHAMEIISRDPVASIALYIAFKILLERLDQAPIEIQNY